MWTASPALGAGWGVSPLSCALSQTQLGSGLFCPPAIPMGRRKLSRVPALALGSTPAQELPNAFPKVRLASPGSDCPHETR